ncbi:MAG TPA: polysaccharide biosynthesis protein [Candidatus Angelobacter sp.]|nr:polysaccharide biosynthesis protein [Candidatus Angelobacter sp.]
MGYLDGKRILVTGGTGSLGKTLVRRLLTGEMGLPERITVFSRDEAKQNDMRLSYLQRPSATDEVIYENSRSILAFRIGDVRDYASVCRAVCDANVIVHAAALKQVPTCEYFPFEAVQTNILGPQNVVRAIIENDTAVETVVGISTDKACQPVNVMGMTKALQERVFLQANMECPRTRFICVRYGNVIASRGSVVPLFLEQIANGGPVTITDKEMTRFLLSLDHAVDTVFAAIRGANRGETYVPIVAAAQVVEIARAMINGRDIPLLFTGIRPGEKVHEILVSREESQRSVRRDGYYVIGSILPEVQSAALGDVMAEEYSSSEVTLRLTDLQQMLRPFMGEEVEAGVLAA